MGGRVAVPPMGDRAALSANLVVNEILRPGWRLDGDKGEQKYTKKKGKKNPISTRLIMIRLYKSPLYISANSLPSSDGKNPGTHFTKDYRFS